MQLKTVLILISVLFLTSAEAQDHFKIGLTIPFSGSSAEYGRYIQEGFELARSQSSRRDSIELLYEDDECNGAKGAAATQKLIETEKIDALFGGFCSAVVLAQIPIVQRASIVQMANAVAPQIRDAGEWVYRINADGEAYLGPLVPFLVKEEKIRNWAILHVINDFGNSQAEVFTKLTEGRGGKITVSEEYLPGVNDFRTQLLRIKGSKPDGVFIVGYAESTNAIRQMSETGLKAVVAASTPFDNPQQWSLIAGTDAVVFFPSSFDPDSERESMKKFREAYQKKSGTLPTQYAMMGFEAFSVFERLMASCGHDRECMRQHLDNDTFPGVQGDLRFDTNGDAIRPIYVKKLQQGRVEVVSGP